MSVWGRDDRADDDGGPVAEVYRLPGAELVPVHQPPPDTRGAEVTAPPPPVGSGGGADMSPLVPARLLELAERQAARPLLPSVARLWSTAGWCARRSPRLVLLAARGALWEIVPVCRGFGWVARGWWRWVCDTRWREEVWEPSKADGPGAAQRSKDWEGHQARMRFRSVSSLVVSGPAAGGVWWAVEVYPGWSALVGAGVVGVLEWIGHKVAPRDTVDEPEAVEPPPRLLEGSPPKVIAKWVVQALVGAGLDDIRVGSVRFDPQRMEYRMEITSAYEIKPDDLRAVELHCDFPENAVRMVKVEESSQQRVLVIRSGDPLATTPAAPWIPTGSRSCLEPLDLGVSAGGAPFAPVLAGVHTAVLGTTGSGKTEGVLRCIIDRLSACRDAVLWGIDLSDGPEFVLWRGVFQKLARDEREADDLLTALWAEKRRRGAILDAIALDDDPTNDTTVWGPELGPFLFVIIDEFSDVAAYNGRGSRKDAPNLFEQVERGARVLRKFGIYLILGTQNAGTGDWGSTQLWRLLMMKIVGPCEIQDATTVFGAKQRDLGWAPHLLQPAQRGSPNDAGKVFVAGPGFTEPEIRRVYRPSTASEVKRRARQRVADGLPALDGGTLDVPPIPECLATIHAAFCAHPGMDYLSAEEIGAWADSAGLRWDNGVRAELRDLNVRTRDKFGAGKRYFRSDVEAAMRAAEDGSGGPR